MTKTSLSLSDDTRFARIATPYPEKLIEMIGYEGQSCHVALWIVAENNALCWFDGKAGAGAKHDAPWESWSTQRDVKFALRSIQLKSDFTDRGYALIFAGDEKAIYVGRLTDARAKLNDLADANGLQGPLDELFTPEELELASKQGFTNHQLTKIANYEHKGSTKPVLH